MTDEEFQMSDSMEEEEEGAEDIEDSSNEDLKKFNEEAKNLFGSEEEEEEMEPIKDDPKRPLGLSGLLPNKRGDPKSTPSIVIDDFFKKPPTTTGKTVFKDTKKKQTDVIKEVFGSELDEVENERKIGMTSEDDEKELTLKSSPATTGKSATRKKPNTTTSQATTSNATAPMDLTAVTATVIPSITSPQPPEKEIEAPKPKAPPRSRAKPATDGGGVKKRTRASPAAKKKENLNNKSPFMKFVQDLGQKKVTAYEAGMPVIRSELWTTINKLPAREKIVSELRAFFSAVIHYADLDEVIKGTTNEFSDSMEELSMNRPSKKMVEAFRLLMDFFGDSFKLPELNPLAEQNIMDMSLM